MQLRLRGARKRGVDLAAVADAERVCQEAAKALVLARQRELTQELLEAELAEQRRAPWSTMCYATPLVSRWTHHVRYERELAAQPE